MNPTPIAIVGRGCVLPGALSPAELWEVIAAGDCALSDATEEDWGVPPCRFLTDPTRPEPDRTWSIRGGFVRGFESAFDPTGFRLPADDVRAAGKATCWLLHAGRQALAEAGYTPLNISARSSLVSGNLSYPTAEHAAFARDVWQHRHTAADPRQRFSSGLPVSLAARGLGCDRGGLALDAACASTLYAVKFACDLLRDGESDLVLAGAVNAADPLFIQLGFAALGALSRGGCSRPFHRDADGLLPAQGGVVLALRRLEDALADGQRVLGVVRAVGLSNDGAAGGILSPDAEGQFRAMHEAYRTAGIKPTSVSLVECHATGTQVGDRTELASLGRLFTGAATPAIGSVKANMGHLLAAAGGAAVLKVLGAFEHGILPATPGCDEPLPELAASGFRLLRESEAWDAARPRRAAVSAFGFGGCNSHLILEEWAGDRPAQRSAPTPPAADVAVVALGVRASGGTGTDDFLRHLFVEAPEPVELPGGGEGFPAGLLALDPGLLRIPPQDLPHTLGQQTLLRLTALETLREIALPADRTGVFVGMGCDPEAARHAGRWLATPGEADGWAPPLTAARVKGTMPNIPASQLNRFFGFRGPALTVSAEEASGVAALQLGRRALAAGEIDAAVVAAVDLNCETVHRAAAVEVLPADRQTPADAAVVLVLRRLADARAANERVLAVLPAKTDGPAAALALALDATSPGLAPRMGHPHAGSGLLLVAAAAAACGHAARPAADGVAVPWIAPAAERKAEVRVRSLGGEEYRVRLHAAEAPARPVPAERLVLRCYAGADRGDLAARVSANHEGGHGPTRLVLLGRDAGKVGRLRAAAVEAMRQGRDPAGRGICFAARPIGGEVGFVFAPAAAGYPGMGRGLLLGFPELWESLQACGDLGPVAEVLELPPEAHPAPMQTATASWAMCQFHAAWTLGRTGMRPQAALGVSSGEVAALEAFGAWGDPHRRREEWVNSGILERDLAGECRSVRRYWEERGLLAAGEQVDYGCWHVRHPVAELRAALAGEPRVRITTIFAPDECCLGGQVADCERVLGRAGARARRMGFDVAAHCPEATPSAELWRRLSHRTTRPVPGVRFYTNATNSWYHPTADAAADAYTRQALAAIDFPATVERAWADGVRVFVEHGPRGMLSRCVERILGGREHLAIPLDVAGQNPVRQLLEATARLWCAGVPLDVGELRAAAARFAPPVDEPRPGTITVATRWPEVRLPKARPVSRGRSSTRATARASIASVQQEWLACMTRAHTAFLATGRRVLASRRVSPPPQPPEPLPAEDGMPAPVMTREQLERHASGNVSEVFGPRFAEQDRYPVQVRMPVPPLLLADRVVRLEGEPGSLGTGAVSTETDVGAGSWYLHAGRMTPGLMIEAGQADLLLVSYLGIDLEVRGRRRYRLLGCDLTFHGPQARPGETLRYDIEIDGHARSGDVRMFFFHYDCTAGGKPRMAVRNGQAGFFTEEELAASEGVIWDPATAAFDRDARLDPPRVRLAKSALSEDEVRAFAAGDAFGCFGTGFEWAAPHTRTPGIPAGTLQLLDRVAVLDHAGGPWGRGYLRAEFDVRPDAWFFAGHFKGDPCMPGTLMFDGCLQAMAVYLASLGYTLDRDGWRFEPVTGRELRMRCRGQVVPTSRLLTYEVFVESVADGDEPTLIADVLCTVDGLKAFHCRGVGLRLVPGWPLEHAAEPPGEAVRGDHAAMMACALGRPTRAFGRGYERFDGPCPVPRLPGPPYLFMSRVTRMPADPWAMRAGASVEAELDIDAGDWYFADGGTGAMPFSVLAEAALQPCGWLAAFVGCALNSAGAVRFRNLDGVGTVHGPVLPDRGPLVTRATLTSLSRAGATTLTGFRVECEQAGEPVFSLQTMFGFFPPAALAEQIGIPAEPDAVALFDAPATAVVDLRDHPVEFFAGTCRLAGGRLLMLDRVTHAAPRGGKAGLGALRAEKDVDPREWFFKAHFFQDPVQPGSLGLEAMLQLLQFHMLHTGMHRGRKDARFEPVTPGPVEWKFRGQVLPTSNRITITAEITGVSEDDTQAAVTAEASLWVDGLRVYHAKSIGMRIVGRRRTQPAVPEVREAVFDPDAHPWVRDHCPTYVLPALPLMCLADRLAAAAQEVAPEARVVGLRDVRVFRWLLCDRPRRLRTETVAHREGEWKVLLRADAGPGTWDLIATGTMLTAADWPEPPPPLPPLEAGEAWPSPYSDGRVFHGPALHYLSTLRFGPGGSSFRLDPGAGTVEPGVLAPGLLDGGTHGIPHVDMHHWFGEVGRDVVSYPQAIRAATFHGPTPTAAPVRCEIRPLRLESGRPLLSMHYIHGDRLWAEILLEVICLPKGPLGGVTPTQRVAFLRDRQFVAGMGLARRYGGATVLERRAVAASDWLPGTVAAVYAAEPGADVCRQVAVKDHVAAIHRVHPSAVRWRDGDAAATVGAVSHAVRVEEQGDSILVRDAR
jgi:acyl transferase domain-containing protein/3-hydroxymyristoyl/3-hydroxydecanoyl-(acyl carrier protein) dehydratase